MFIPNLDRGLPFEELGNFQGNENRIGYEVPFQLNKRCDVLLITVTFADEQTTYDSAGFITQYWVKDGVRHQTEYERIWVNTKTIIKLEPLENSLIIFRPVDWLRNWSVNLKVRPYQPQSITEIDFSSIEENLELLRSQFELGFDTIDANTVDAFNAATEQRLEILQEINRNDAGILSLAEGLADLLPEGKGEELKQQTRNRLNSDLGFI